MSVIYCPLCPFYDVELIRVVRHIGVVHSCENNFQMTCGLDECERVFTSFEAYRRHLYRTHNISGTSSTVTTPSGSAEPACAGDPSCSSTPQFDDTTEPCDNRIPHTEKRSFLQQVKKSLILFRLKVTERLKLPNSTADKIFMHIKTLFSISLQSFAEEISKELKLAGISEGNSDALSMMLNTEDLLDFLFAEVESQQHRENYIKTNLPYTEVKEIVLQQQGATKQSLHYIPLPSVLKNLIASSDMYECMVQIQDQRKDGILNDFCDGNFVKNQQQAVMTESQQHTILILLYTDELELNNPLGSAAGKHKMLLVYFSILNLHVRHRSKLDQIHLLLIVPYASAVQFGLEAILAPLIEDLNFLRSHGLEVKDQTFLVCTVAIVGDNLSMHRLAGLSCGFSKGRVCRFCMARYEDLNELTTEAQCIRRTALSHASHQAAYLLDPSRNGPLYGIAAISPLDSLNGFDITKQLPPDAMHDILEGAIAFVLKAVISGLVSTNVITKSDLKRVAEFPYGVHDRKSKPVFQADKFLSSSGTLRGTASQKWCLFRLLPQILGHKITEGDSNWDVYLAFRSVVDIILAENIPSDCVAYLQVKITEFIELFKQQYPQKHLTPKIHYLLHYPGYILEFGPARRFWGMRFEAKHSYFKNLASKVKNFRNIGKTLSKRHQLLQAYEMTSDPLSEPVKVTGATSFEPASLPQDIASLLPQQMKDATTLTSAKSVTFIGRTYKIEDAFVHAFDNGHAQFAKVCVLLVSRGILAVIARSLATAEVSKHRCSHLVFPTEELICVMPTEQFEYYPLDCYEYEGKIEIVPHYELFGPQ